MTPLSAHAAGRALQPMAPPALPQRPGLGGTAPQGTPTQGTGGGTGGGGEGPIVITTAEQYASYLVLLAAIVFGIVGFFQGLPRSVVAFLFTITAALAISFRWPAVAAALNKAWQIGLKVLAALPLPGSPGANAPAAIVPVEGSAATFWQLALFAAAVLLGYGLGALVFDAPKDGPLNLRAVNVFLSRVFGAFFGGLTGATIAIFVIPRIAPNAQIDMVGPGSVMRHLVDQYGMLIFWSFVILMIIAGLMALRPKPSNKVFN